MGSPFPMTGPAGFGRQWRRREVEDEVGEGGVHLAAGWGLHRPHLESVGPNFLGLTH